MTETTRAPDDDPRARAVAVFMDSLARSPLPRPRAVDPVALMRRAPLVDALAHLRARERRVLGPAIALEVLTFAAAAAVGLQVAATAAPAGPLRTLVEAAVRFAWAPTGLALLVAALPLLWWIAEAAAGPARRLER
ncbi:hypothetical protein [Nannocystis punicea]|uniref:Uncharacterized protein n=1 Tax=Nannocystis punicea TaxID=2995304 RepID=A0ABY7H7V2_9BACT|nr:hypothetical protein [Nannocystis poenicansa]WAS95119.1 hypothetical protein O0S08_03070 [Nannocystis poenicansa]